MNFEIERKCEAEDGGSFGQDDRDGQNWGSEVTELVLVRDGASANGETCTIRFFEIVCFSAEAPRME